MEGSMRICRHIFIDVSTVGIIFKFHCNPILQNTSVDLKSTLYIGRRPFFSKTRVMDLFDSIKHQLFFTFPTH